MLFNSYEFLFLFFPAVFVLFFLAARLSHKLAAGVLTLASLFFYGWWSPYAVPLLLGSIGVNYLFGIRLSRAPRRKAWLWAALAFNLGLLGFFKYANFFVDNVNLALAAAQAGRLAAPDIVLPIGISFYTFTQIAFLVDCWQGKVRERNLLHYALFVSYFPHLVAGPILHHAQMMPQFARPETYRLRQEKIAIALLVFTAGLAKKLLVADPLGVHADAFFRAAAEGGAPGLAASWMGVFAYAFQIYFDFSGYSDMAIGLSLFFGVRMPVNFNSPYQAASIIDFWQRWHMSLSAFLRDYLYIPLGGNRHGKLRRYLNLMVTMLLGGLWHGASWTFVLWGAFHGVLLAINHAWRAAFGRREHGRAGRAACWAATFLAVCLAWVLFRADSAATALRIYQGMLGFNGFTDAAGLGRGWINTVLVAGAIAFFGRNLNRLPDLPLDAGAKPARWLLHPLSGVATAVLLAACIINLARPSPFLYFQF